MISYFATLSILFVFFQEIFQGTVWKLSSLIKMFLQLFHTLANKNSGFFSALTLLIWLSGIACGL